MRIVALVICYLGSAFVFVTAALNFFSGPNVRDTYGAIVLAILGIVMLLAAVGQNLEIIGATPPNRPSIKGSSNSQSQPEYGSRRILTLDRSRQQQPMRRAA